MWRLLVCLTVLCAPAMAAECRYLNFPAPTRHAELFPATAFGELGLRFATNPAFTTDFRRFVFTAVDASNPRRVQAQLMESVCTRGVWSTPAPADALNQADFTSAEAVFSPDGRWVYFTSNRPPGARPWIVKVFRARLKSHGYAAPELVAIPAPPGAGLFYPRFRADGALFLTSDGLAGARRGDLFEASKTRGGFAAPLALAGDFNSAENDWDLIEHPDGALRIWASGRAGGAGQIDLWFSQRDAGGWSAARNLAAVNTAGFETAPSFGPDGKVLFFQRHHGGPEQVYWIALDAALAGPPPVSRAVRK